MPKDSKDSLQIWSCGTVLLKRLLNKWWTQWFVYELSGKQFSLFKTYRLCLNSENLQQVSGCICSFIKHCLHNQIPLYFRYFSQKWIAVPLSNSCRYWVKNSARFELNSGVHRYLATLAPLITEKAPCMYKGYIYSKDDVRSPFVKPPW
jgi:hypothetical protein